MTMTVYDNRVADGKARMRAQDGEEKTPAAATTLCHPQAARGTVDGTGPDRVMLLMPPG